MISKCNIPYFKLQINQNYYSKNMKYQGVECRSEWSRRDNDNNSNNNNNNNNNKKSK